MRLADVPLPLQSNAALQLRRDVAGGPVVLVLLDLPERLCEHSESTRTVDLRVPLPPDALRALGEALCAAADEREPVVPIRIIARCDP